MKSVEQLGPDKFDAELLLDGKAFNPQQVTDSVVTGTNISGASLILPAFGLGEFGHHIATPQTDKEDIYRRKTAVLAHTSPTNS